SDIFSLGAGLYEMVTGNRAFRGNSDFSVASDILHRDPEPLSTLQTLSAPALERTIRVCMAKDPDERWQSASDLWNELRWISEGGSKVRLDASLADWLSARSQEFTDVAACAVHESGVDRGRAFRRYRGGHRHH